MSDCPGYCALIGGLFGKGARMASYVRPCNLDPGNPCQNDVLLSLGFRKLLLTKSLTGAGRGISPGHNV
jgi:hypothetical protein